MSRKNKNLLFRMAIFVVIILGTFVYRNYIKKEIKETKVTNIVGLDINNLPEYKGKPYVVINNNEPNFEKK